MSHIRSLNRVILVGRVGKDPEITHIPSLGKDVAKFGLATSEGYMDKNQQWQETTEWHNIVAWDWLAKKAEKSVSKGIMVLIEGKLKTRKWQDKETGQERRTTEIYADTLVPLEKSNKSGAYAGADYETQQPGDYRPQQRTSQAPPEMQIDEEIPYDESSEPF
ncbi:MAG: single-stranded DNA-binding protein [Candidatus Aminicenantes bacterium]|nr:single-stranded DNA-binding protein [Candidatus Aminicenantes bacterium]